MRTLWLRKAFLLLVWALAACYPAGAATAADLPGVVVDNAQAEIVGQWTASTSVKPYWGEGYLNVPAGTKDHAVKFAARLPQPGKYQVLILYSSAGNRAKNTPVTVHAAEGAKSFAVDQTRPGGGPFGFFPLGEFSFAKDEARVEIVSNGADGYVMVDALWVIAPEAFAALVKQPGPKPPLLVGAPAASTLAAPLKPQPARPMPVKPAPPKAATAAAPPAPVPPPQFQPLPAPAQLARLSPAQLDALLKTDGSGGEVATVDDVTFLRRVTLDLIGRQPTLEEIEAYLAGGPDRREAAIDRLLASPQFGANWANYWSDVMGYRMQEPELTFHDYKPLKRWLAGELNAGRRWDSIVFRLLTATGKVGERPESTFIAFHQANASKLAGETTRVFLGLQIACAECHDHPFVDMPQATFHGLAAFFARTGAKIAQNNSDLIEVLSKADGEHKMPGQKEPMRPAMYQGEVLDLGLSDLDRRARLAEWVVHPENPFFARATVNRVWSRLMGRGFCEPVDNVDDGSNVILPEVHAALAGHFVATGYDFKELLRVVATTRAYQRPLAADAAAGAVAKKLRGDEVFDSLVAAIGLPNITPPQEKPNGVTRFPPPPKSTRDLVNEAFGYDPSFSDDLLLRTMKQAMFLMNNEQIQRQVDARPESGTFLAQLLAAETDDARVIERLYLALLARRPTERELGIARKHLAAAPSRGEGMEDLLWALLNSAELTTRK